MSLAKARVDIIKPQYQSKHLLTAPPVASCTTPLSGLVEMALFSSSAACFSSGVSDGTDTLMPFIITTSNVPVATSDSSRSIAFDAGLTCAYVLEARDHHLSNRDSSQRQMLLYSQ